jgi:hypothetical protein
MPHGGRRKTMARYRMDDGTVVDTANATKSWDEARDHDGRNHISRATGSQWDHETLYRSRRGRYYLEHDSQWQGSRPWAEWLSNQRAAAWLALNSHEIPDELRTAAEAVTE